MEKINKIALVGTCCVGKTSLGLELKRQVDERLTFVDEAARAYFETFQTTVSHGFEAQWGIQTLAFLNEQRSVGKGGILVCDRSVLDAAVYSRVNGDINGSELLFRRARGWLSTYSGLFVLDPTGVPYVQDDIRTESPEVREMLHQGFVDFFLKKVLHMNF